MTHFANIQNIRIELINVIKEYISDGQEIIFDGTIQLSTNEYDEEYRASGLRQECGKIEVFCEDSPIEVLEDICTDALAQIADTLESGEFSFLEDE